MPNYVGVKLVNGDVHKILAGDDLAETYKLLERKSGPFANEWLETETGSGIRRDAIVEYWGETRSDNPT